jgi:hypothetical protein
MLQSTGRAPRGLRRERERPSRVAVHEQPRVRVVLRQCHEIAWRHVVAELIRENLGVALTHLEGHVRPDVPEDEG